jgi:hypothetical protein
LIVDDLVDTGKTGRLVRDMMPDAHFATGLRQAAGTAAGRHLHHRSVAGHLDLLSLGHRAVVPAADPRRRGVNYAVIASAAKQSIARQNWNWIASSRRSSQ